MLRQDPSSPVRLRVRVLAPEGARDPRVELLGETNDWQNGLLLDVVGTSPSGELIAEKELSLPISVLSYKLRVNGHWQLDLDNPRTRSRDKKQNNILSIGGAPEPLLFAPAPPFVEAHPEGGLVVFAGLRRGHGNGLSLFYEGQRIDMSPHAEEDEHIFFRAHLPAAKVPFSCSFDLEDGSRSDVFLCETTASDDDLPDWLKDGVVYTIFVDRFAPDPKNTRSFATDIGREKPAFGHLDGIRRALPRLADLGVTILYLTPVTVAASCHRYDLVDPLQIDPLLGGESSFDRLIEEAHALGLRVLVDLSFSHAGRGFPPFEDVLQNGPASPYAKWFHWTQHKNGRPKLLHYGRRHDAPLLNLESDDVRALALATAERFAARGVDGFRLDMAAEVPLDLARAIRAILRDKRGPSTVMLGELVPAHAHRWIRASALDIATDFGYHDILVDLLAARRISVETAKERLRLLEIDRGAPSARSLRFVSTHDHPRFSSIARKHGSPSGILGLFLLLASPGVPALLYGEEYDLFAETPVSEPEDVWPDRLPLPLSPSASQARFSALVKTMLALRAERPSLRRGALSILHAEDDIFLARRSFGADVIDIVVNLGEAAVVDLDDDALPRASLLFSIGDVSFSSEALSLGRDAAALIERRPG